MASSSDDSSLLGLLGGVGLFLAGIAIGGDMWITSASPLGGLILATGVIGGVVLLAFAYA